MKLGFEETPQAAYDSGSQKARVLTETWASMNAFCPNCGAERLSSFENNRPVADLYCTNCHEEFELKSQKAKFGAKVADGAYRTMINRLAAQNNPNLMLINYNPIAGVSNLFVVPKYFFVTEIIEERKPLAATARRAGWIGCNILLSRVPDAGKIFLVRDSIVVDRQSVLDLWRKTIFLRDESRVSAGWLLSVLKCVEDVGKKNSTSTTYMPSSLASVGSTP